MSNIQILDCTLRDGGYINDFRFGRRAIVKIIDKLTQAGVDIIETGFLEDGVYDVDSSVYTSVSQIASLLPAKRGKSMYVAMACYGEYDLGQLDVYDGEGIDGIRVTFHYNEVEEALEYCREIQRKGYKVFVQPVGTSSYTDSELLNLIEKVNELKPYAFYLVDTLGLMLEDEVLRFFYLINHNLADDIHIGLHSHNNLQLSYSNCQVLTKINTSRTISLDSSVYGMGRGAGNLNTELIAQYLNEHKEGKYEIECLLEIVDEFILKIKHEHEWGYSVPYYLAAIHGCHPNYASYFAEKNTLTVKDIASILQMIEPAKRSLFSKELAEMKYLEFQSREVDDSKVLEYLREAIGEHNVLLIAPGASISDNIERIKRIAQEKACVVIGISFVPDFIECDFIFLSNLKRYNTTFNPMKKAIRLIHTSNIEVNEGNVLTVNYSSLINPENIIRDNSMLMALNMISILHAEKVFIAGMDGYAVSGPNYYQERLGMNHDTELIRQINQAVRRRIEQLSNRIDIEFLTPSRYKNGTKIL